MDTMAIITITLTVLLVIMILLVLHLVGKLNQQGTLLAAHHDHVENESRKRIDKSRSVIMGQVAEHFAPFLPGFRYHFKDARFLGAPVDFIVFNGLHDGRDELELVFCEVKTGKAGLSASESAIQRAVQEGRVRFEVLRLGEQGFTVKG